MGIFLLYWAVNADAGRVVKTKKIVKVGCWSLATFIIIMIVLAWHSPFILFNNDGPYGAMVHYYQTGAPAGAAAFISFGSGIVIGLPIAFFLNRKKRIDIL